MVKLSVIVPIYNAEKYLEQCIASLLAQDYEDMEIILVDDGSTDGSGRICDQYQNVNRKIQVIHQKNEGSVAARLQGLKNSRGEYISFVDSDDWVDPDMYQTLMAVVEERKCDIVSMGYKLVYGNEEEKKDDATSFGFYEKGRNLDILLSNMMYDARKRTRGVHPSLCTKVIKRELLISVYTKIDKNITLGEDAATFYPCCLQSNSIYILKEYKYHYRVHSESMCRNMSIDTMYKIYLFYQYMQKILLPYKQQYGLQEQLKRYVWEFLAVALDQVFMIHVKTSYIFPYSMVERNTNIILYGAGEVGQVYYSQIMENHYCNIVAWADKNKNAPWIIRPEKILDLEYTRIIIAIKNKEVAEEIINELIILGIAKEKILWNIPQENPVITF